MDRSLGIREQGQGVVDVIQRTKFTLTFSLGNVLYFTSKEELVDKMQVTESLEDTSTLPYGLSHQGGDPENGQV